MKKILFFILVLFIGIKGIAQNTVSYPKNSIYVNFGIIGLGGGVNLNYERMLLQSEGFFKQYGIRIGGGYWSTIGSRGAHVLGNFVAITGRKKNHFELIAGGFGFYDDLSYNIGVSNASFSGDPIPSRSDYLNLLPSILLGYRYQKPSGGFLFRSGISYPEGAYIGLGIGF